MLKTLTHVKIINTINYEEVFGRNARHICADADGLR